MQKPLIKLPLSTKTHVAFVSTRVLPCHRCPAICTWRMGMYPTPVLLYAHVCLCLCVCVCVVVRASLHVLLFLYLAPVVDKLLPYQLSVVLRPHTYLLRFFFFYTLTRLYCGFHFTPIRMSIRYSCGERIRHLMNAYGSTLIEATAKVVSQYPKFCAACASMSTQAPDSHVNAETVTRRATHIAPSPYNGSGRVASLMGGELETATHA